MAVLVIDPGHGGSTAVGGSSPNNATGPNGTLEKNLTLQVGLLMRDALAANGHTVVLTRTSDTNLGLEARATLARSASADAFLSIHFNGWPDPKVQGTETFVHTQASASSLALAKMVQAQALDATGLADRGVKKMDLGVLVPSRHADKTAACLVELSFLTDPKEEHRLADAAYLKQIADALCAALDTYVTSPAASVPSEQSEDGFAALRAVPALAEASFAAVASDDEEPQAWQALAPTVSMALGFWKDYLKLQTDSGDLDLVGIQRLTQIIRAISWVESRHGTGAGPGQAARDPMQCGNPGDVWWQELSGQIDHNHVDYLARWNGQSASLVAADKLADAAKAAIGFPSAAALDLLADDTNGHNDSSFGPTHSFVWGIPYFLHRMNRAQQDKTYDCGDLSRDRMVTGAVQYNGGGDPHYGTKIDAALKLVGDVKPLLIAAAAAAPTAKPQPLDQTAAALLAGLTSAAPVGPYRIKFQFDARGSAIESVEIEGRKVDP